MGTRQALLVEDDPDTSAPLAQILSLKGYSVSVAESLESARLALTGSLEPDLIITDLGLPDGDGMELIAFMVDMPGRRAGVVLTGERRVERAVEAMRLGAIDYLTKPLRPELLEATLTRVERYLSDVEEQHALRKELARHGTYQGMVGRSPVMQRVYELVERAAPSRIPVFIRGESGTGKELLARAIHRVSPRRSKPFVAVNCGAIPANLAESEFFGHEKGAFTGATARREGVFEQAHLGTLFLDELAEMPVDLQVRLLRVLEEGAVRRVGGTRDIPVDVRVVSATNRDPEEAVAKGLLRDDLYFRLHVFPIDMPPLRERRSDVPLLAKTFVEQVASTEGGNVGTISDDAVEALMHCEWPGNVRELRNVISRAWLLANGGMISAVHLPETLVHGKVIPTPIEAAATSDGVPRVSIPFGATLDDAERLLVTTYLDYFGGHREKTASALGVTPKTLYNKCKAWGITPQRASRFTEPSRH